MKSRLAALAIMLLVTGSPSQSLAASLAGYSGVNLKIRSGPSTKFPTVGVLGAGSSLAIHGCLTGYTWCDISASGVRGWASAAHIQFVHEARRVYVPAYAVQAALPVITFNIGGYWNDYYRDQPFYSDLGRWTDHHWENEGSPPGWRDNWDDSNVDHEY